MLRPEACDKRLLLEGMTWDNGHKTPLVIRKLSDIADSVSVPGPSQCPRLDIMVLHSFSIVIWWK